MSAKNLARHIKTVRIEKGLSLIDFAGMVGVQEIDVIAFESGSGRFDEHTLGRVIDVLSYSVNAVKPTKKKVITYDGDFSFFLNLLALGVPAKSAAGITLGLLGNSWDSVRGILKTESKALTSHDFDVFLELLRLGVPAKFAAMLILGWELDWERLDSAIVKTEKKVLTFRNFNLFLELLVIGIPSKFAAMLILGRKLDWEQLDG